MTTNEDLSKALEIITQAKLDVLSVLDPKNHGLIVVSIEANFTRMENQLSFLAGNGHVLSKESQTKFQPVTELMGVNINRAKKVTRADLSPNELEKQRFISSVNQAEKQIMVHSDEEILQIYGKDPDNSNSLRALAKRVGIDNYLDAKIDLDFIQLTRAALEEYRGKREQSKNLKAKLEKDAEPSKETIEANQKAAEVFKDEG